MNPLSVSALNSAVFGVFDPLDIGSDLPPSPSNDSDSGDSGNLASPEKENAVTSVQYGVTFEQIIEMFDWMENIVLAELPAEGGGTFFKWVCVVSASDDVVLHPDRIVCQFYKFNSINKGYISIQDMYNIRKMFFNSLDALVEAHSVDFRGFDLFRFYSDRYRSHDVGNDFKAIKASIVARFKNESMAKNAINTWDVSQSLYDCFETACCYVFKRDLDENIKLSDIVDSERKVRVFRCEGLKNRIAAVVVDGAEAYIHLAVIEDQYNRAGNPHVRLLDSSRVERLPRDKIFVYGRKTLYNAIDSSPFFSDMDVIDNANEYKFPHSKSPKSDFLVGRAHEKFHIWTKKITALPTYHDNVAIIIDNIIGCFTENADIVDEFDGYFAIQLIPDIAFDQSVTHMLESFLSRVKSGNKACVYYVFCYVHSIKMLAMADQHTKATLDFSTTEFEQKYDLMMKFIFKPEVYTHYETILHTIVNPIFTTGNTTSVNDQPLYSYDYLT